MHLVNFVIVFTCIPCELDRLKSTMARRVARVSEAQFDILLDFLERNPNLARTRVYNNSARGRAESSRLWAEVAKLLNADGIGTTKTPKEWSIYVSNYKSKLKKIVADINTDTNATGGGPPQASQLSATEQRFLALMGHRFGQSAALVSVQPFPEMDLPQPSTPTTPQTHHIDAEDLQEVVVIMNEDVHNTESRNRSPISIEPIIEIVTAPNSSQAPASVPSLGTRQRRYRSRPLAPLDEARRILSQVETQRAAADAEQARSLKLIADAIVQGLSSIAQAISGLQAQAMQ